MIIVCPICNQNSQLDIISSFTKLVFCSDCQFEGYMRNDKWSEYRIKYSINNCNYKLVYYYSLDTAQFLFLNENDRLYSSININSPVSILEAVQTLKKLSEKYSNLKAFL